MKEKKPWQNHHRDSAMAFFIHDNRRLAERAFYCSAAFYLDPASSKDSFHSVSILASSSILAYFIYP